MEEIKFEAGNRIVWHDKNIEVIKKIGAGMTAEVFLAKLDDREVAIKVLRNGVGEDVRNIFLDEPINLMSVRTVWQEKFPGKPLIIPNYYSAEGNGDNPFIIIELIKGKKLADVAKDSQGLNEGLAFWIGQQIGDLINLLHDKLGKCYSDIKLDNFWLIDNPGDANKPWVKITDWSILAEKDESGVQRDLFFASLIMNYTFTGSMPEYSINRITTRLEDAQKFDTLSTGTKEFLNRSLSQNFSRRYQDSKSWSNEVHQLYALWRTDRDELLPLAKQRWQSMELNLSKKDYVLAAKDYDLARAYLEIAGEKGAYSDEWQEYWDKVEQYQEEQSYFGRGKISLLGSGFEQAIEYFLEGADIYPIQSEKLWRWSWLAKGAYSLGMDHFRTVREDAVEAVTQLVEKNTTSAEAIFSRIEKRLQENNVKLPNGFLYLLNEARVINLCSSASDLRTMGKYDEAIENLKLAEKYADTLPENPPIHWADDYGNASQLLDEVLKEKRTLGESSDHLDRAVALLNEGNIQEAAQEYRLAFTKAPNSNRVLFEWRKAIENEIHGNRLQNALILVKKAYGTHATDSLQDLYKLCMNLDALQVSALSPDEKNFLALLDDFVEKKENQSYVNGKIFRNICNDARKAALESRKFTLAAQIAQKMVVLWPDARELINRDLESAISESIKVLNDTYILGLGNAGRLRLSEKDALKDVYDITKVLAEFSDIETEGLSNTVAAKTLTKSQNTLRELKQTLEARVDRRKRMDATQIKAIDGRVTELQQKIISLIDPNDLHHMTTMDKRVATAMAYLAEWAVLDHNKSAQFSAMREKVQYLEIVYGAKAWKNTIHEIDVLLENDCQDQAQFMIDTLNVITNSKIGEIDSSFSGVKRKNEAINKFTSFMEDKWKNYEDVENEQQLWKLIDLIQGYSVPRIYWDKYEITDVLEKTFENAKFDISTLNDSGDIVFSELLWELLVSGNLLAQIKKEKTTSDIVTSLDELLQIANRYFYSDSKDKQDCMNELISYISVWNGEFPEIHEINAVNTQLFEKESEARMKHERKKLFVKLLSITLAILVVLGLLGTGGYYGYQYELNRVTQTPVIETVIAEVIVTTTPLVPTPTIAPTPTSQFDKIPLDNIFPEPPYGYEPLYLIDDNSAIYEPSTGISYEVSENGIGGNHRAYAGIPEGINATVSWIFDQPVLETGKYELFVLDAIMGAGSSKPLTYAVYDNDTLQIPISGSNTIVQKFSAAQDADEWTSIGIYEFQQNSQIKIVLTIPNTLGGTYERVGVDAVLMTRLPVLDPLVIQPLIAPNVVDKNILYTINDRYAAHEPNDQNIWIWQDNNPGNWNGVYTVSIATDDTATYQVGYNLDHPLYPGTYEVWMWLPADAKIPIDFKSKLTYINGSAVANAVFTERLTSNDPVAEGFQGKALPLAKFTLDKSAYIHVEATSAGTDGIFAVDDIYLALVSNE